MSIIQIRDAGSQYHLCADAHLLALRRATFTTVQTSLCFPKPSVLPLAAFLFDSGFWQEIAAA